MGAFFPKECLQIRESFSNDWDYIDNGQIEGFDYQPGYEYVLRIRTEKVENAPADAPNIRCILLEVVSKVQK
ncbi:DUF4377 domain-containing protein [Chryseobacterium nematophagum]|uniref:DUF4377 domain-containing protein n=2 Tax=Chryseobacterium nematophagum TaxID=2305228 RepID=A0A3M7LC77_9FLAO|nr:DUF4377 domain-containing protein [Chryseobacterium nematophagum]